MEKVRRVLAMIGVVVLVLCYVMSLITAVMATPEAHDWFIASVGATILVPTVLYGFSIILRVSNRNEEETRLRENAYLQQMKAQLKQNEEKQDGRSGEQNANGNTGL